MTDQPYDTGLTSPCANCGTEVMQVFDPARTAFTSRHTEGGGNLTCDDPQPLRNVEELLPQYLCTTGGCSYEGCRALVIACVPIPTEIAMWEWRCGDHIRPGTAEALARWLERPGVAPWNKGAASLAFALINNPTTPEV